MKLLVLDLDETLIHTVFTENNEYKVHKRPNLDAFLSYLSRVNNIDYKIGIWSAGSEEYVNKIVKDHISKFFTPLFILSRNDCKTCVNRHYKTLCKISSITKGSILLSDILIIDDLNNTTGRYDLNHLVIKKFNDVSDEDDDTFIKLIKLLDNNKNETVQHIILDWKKNY
jgi:TFIIF-interacting CTD phosphatase-like protein